MGGMSVSPRVPNSFNFMQFFENLAKWYVGVPTGKLVPPPWGNPGFTTGMTGTCMVGGMYGKTWGMCGVGGMCGGGGDTCGRRDGHYSGRYASYWNAFLL